MNITTRVEGLDELLRTWSAETSRLEKDLEEAGWQAGKVGVQAAQDSHPYTDRTDMLTGTATCVPPYPCDAGGNAAGMWWPQDYASYVDKGTSRSRPYPFTPRATKTARLELEHLTARCVEDFESRLSR